MEPFLDPATVAGYAEATSRRVPALNDLHRMATQLLSERIGDDACILVLGAFGCLCLRRGARSKAAARSAEIKAAKLTLLSAGEEETLLREAGFHAPAMFCAALSFRGWVAYA